MKMRAVMQRWSDTVFRALGSQPTVPQPRHVCVRGQSVPQRDTFTSTYVTMALPLSSTATSVQIGAPSFGEFVIASVTVLVTTLASKLVRDRIRDPYASIAIPHGIVTCEAGIGMLYTDLWGHILQPMAVASAISGVIQLYNAKWTNKVQRNKAALSTDVGETCATVPSVGNDPTFRELVANDAFYQTILHEIEEILSRNPDYRSFLRYDTQIDLLEELGAVRVERSINGSAWYRSLSNTIGIEPNSVPRSCIHELFHALHFRALVRGMTYRILKQVHETFPKGLLDAGLDADFNRVGDYLANSEVAGQPLPDTVKVSGAQLIWYAANTKCLEAIASRFDLQNATGFEGLIFRMKHLLDRYVMYAAAAPFLWLTGTLEQSFHNGYSNHRLVRRMYKQGLYGSLGFEE